MLEQRSEPGTYMVRELADGAQAELLPVEVIARFRDALKYGPEVGACCPGPVPPEPNRVAVAESPSEPESAAP